MDLLNLSEEEKRQKVESLKESRAIILCTKNSDVLRHEIEVLTATLVLMRNNKSMEKFRETVSRTLDEIRGFKMHDKTRQDVARCVQTLICELNQQ